MSPAAPSPTRRTPTGNHPPPAACPALARTGSLTRAPPVPGLLADATFTPLGRGTGCSRSACCRDADHRLEDKRTPVTLAPSVPDHSMWMSHSCSWNDMAGTSTPYPRSRAAAADEHHGPQGCAGMAGAPAARPTRGRRSARRSPRLRASRSPLTVRMPARPGPPAAGAEVGRHDAARDGMTALHAACWRGLARVAQELLDAGADPALTATAGPHQGQTPADTALAQRHLLLAARLDVPGRSVSSPYGRSVGQQHR